MEKVEDLCPESWYQVHAQEGDRVEWCKQWIWKVCLWFCCLPMCYPCYFSRTYRNNLKKRIKQQPLLHRPLQLGLSKSEAIPPFRSLHCLRAEEELRWVGTQKQGITVLQPQKRQSENIPAEELQKLEITVLQPHQRQGVPAEETKKSDKTVLQPHQIQGVNIPAEETHKLEDILRQSKNLQGGIIPAAETHEISPTHSLTPLIEASTRVLQSSHESDSTL